MTPAMSSVQHPTSHSWLRSALAPIRLRYKELVVFSLFINLLALATPVFVLQVYDRVVFHSGLSTLQALAAGMMIVLAFDFVLRQARSRLMQRVAMGLDIDLGRKLFDRLSSLPLNVLEARPAGYWQSLHRDAEMVRGTLTGPTALLLLDLPFAVLFIGLIFVIARPIVWVLVAALVLFVAIAVASSFAVQSASRRERDATLSREGMQAELIAGRTTVKALGLDEWARTRWEARHAEAVGGLLRRAASADGYGNISTGLVLLTTIAMTVVGALAILEQEMTIGALIAANMLSSRIVSPLGQLVTAWRGIAGYRQAVRRLDAVFAGADDRPAVEIALERPSGALSLEKLQFAFAPNAAPVIDGVHFTIKPGGLHAIVGPNGGGKSTLLKLMQGLYAPTAGRVLLDGADVQQLSRRQLAAWIGYVPQEIFLFAGTIRENLAMRLPHSTDADVIAAAKLAGVHDLIVDLPDGYGADIGEAGGRLSGGFRQRIAITRALLGQPPVLLLDEPTASLDRQAEERLCDTLVALARERNVVVVTHSPVLLSAADNIIVLERGRVSAAGPAKEMLPRLFAGNVERLRARQ
jgi:ATP-binding cassette subfamily C protein LapB